MSEDESRRVGNTEEPQDEVEAHRAAAKSATDEGQTEGDDNDVEAHRHPKTGRPGKTA
jgi:hypothetical protein